MGDRQGGPQSRRLASERVTKLCVGEGVFRSIGTSTFGPFFRGTTRKLTLLIVIAHTLNYVRRTHRSDIGHRSEED
jgi:hypothetical protein